MPAKKSNVQGLSQGVGAADTRSRAGEEADVHALCQRFFVLPLTVVIDRGESPWQGNAQPLERGLYGFGFRSVTQRSRRLDLLAGSQIQEGGSPGMSTTGRRAIETRGSPDPWWLASSELCFVFEDHSEALPTSELNVTKARQVQSHPAWILSNGVAAQNADVIPVLITPVRRAEPEALVHLNGVCLWPLEDFRVWSREALQVVRELRRTFVEAGDAAWRTGAMESYRQAKLGPQGLAQTLRTRAAMVMLEDKPGA